MTQKISIRFYGDRLVRAAWDDRRGCWLFSLTDVVGAINGESDHNKNRNYWKYLKGKLRRDQPQLVSDTNRLPLEAPDGRHHPTDVADTNTIAAIAAYLPGTKAVPFVAWLTGHEDSIDGRSKTKAYALFDDGLLDSIEVGTVKGLRQIHEFLFGGLYDFAGQIRTKNIAKGGFQFAMAQHLEKTLSTIERMDSDSFDEIIDKYVEMNIAHPFMEGNGRATRIWLDMMLRKALDVCVDWSRVDKWAYLEAMRRSVADASAIRNLLSKSLTNCTKDREVFMKGIDYSYYYEE